MRKYKFSTKEVFPLRDGSFEFGPEEAVDIYESSTIEHMLHEYIQSGCFFITRIKIENKDTFVFLSENKKYYEGVFVNN